MLGNGWVLSHSTRAAAVGSMPVLIHQATSSATTVHLTMVSPTEWHSEFVAYLATKCWRLRQIGGDGHLQGVGHKRGKPAWQPTSHAPDRGCGARSAKPIRSCRPWQFRAGLCLDLDDRRVASILSTPLQRSS